MTDDPKQPRTPRLNDADRARYARQIILPEMGEAGQRRLSEARILLVGLGGLGSPCALYLAAAGVGELGLVEFDQVDVSNLQRQILYRDSDRGEPKIQVAEERLRALNPGLVIHAEPRKFEATNAMELVRGYDLVIDGADNFAARYAVNDACVLTGVPNVHGAVQGFEGHVTVLAHEGGPCYRCLFPEPPPPGSVPGCAEAGVLGVLPGTIGLLQATEAIKLITGIGEPLVGRLLRFDALGARFREVRVARDSRCPICGDEPVITEPVAVEDSCLDLTGVEAHQGEGVDDIPFSIGVEELASRRQGDAAPKILDVRLAEELAIAALPGDVVHIPLHELPARIGELDPASEYAVLCHFGVRSDQAVRFLRANGYAAARNIEGGIDRWSNTVDPGTPRY